MNFIFEMGVSHNSLELYISLLHFVLNHYIWNDFQQTPWLNYFVLVNVEDWFLPYQDNPQLLEHFLHG